MYKSVDLPSATACMCSYARQISMTEAIGTEGRGGYFDDVGIIRDVMQNRIAPSALPKLSAHESRSDANTCLGRDGAPRIFLGR